MADVSRSPEGASCDCSKCINRGGFEKLLEFKGGLTVFRHKEPKGQDRSQIAKGLPRVHDSFAGSTRAIADARLDNENDTLLHDNIIIVIHNGQDKTRKSADYLREIDINKVNCPRCRYIMTRAKTLLEKVPFFKKNEIRSLCDHCTLYQQSHVPCTFCQRVINSFADIMKVTGFQKETELKKKFISSLTADAKFLMQPDLNKEIKNTFVFSETDIRKSADTSQSYDHRLHRPKSGTTLDYRTICKCDEKLACLFQKNIAGKKVTIRVKVESSIPDKVSSVQEILKRAEIYHEDEVEKVPVKPIVKPCLETLPRVIEKSDRLKKTPYHSGVQSDTVIGIGTTGILRRTQSEESLMPSVSKLGEENYKMNFKYFFPRIKKKEMQIRKTSDEIIKDTQYRLLEEADKKRKRAIELQEKKQEQMQQNISSIDILKPGKDAIEKLDTKTGKIKMQVKEEEKRHEKDKFEKKKGREQAEKERARKIKVPSESQLPSKAATKGEETLKKSVITKDETPEKDDKGKKKKAPSERPKKEHIPLKEKKDQTEKGDKVKKGKAPSVLPGKEDISRKGKKDEIKKDDKAKKEKALSAPPGKEDISLKEKKDEIKIDDNAKKGKALSEPVTEEDISLKKEQDEIEADETTKKRKAPSESPEREHVPLKGKKVETATQEHGAPLTQITKSDKAKQEIKVLNEVFKKQEKALADKKIDKKSQYDKLPKDTTKLTERKLATSKKQRKSLKDNKNNKDLSTKEEKTEGKMEDQKVKESEPTVLHKDIKWQSSGTNILAQIVKMKAQREQDRNKLITLSQVIPATPAKIIHHKKHKKPLSDHSSLELEPDIVIKTEESEMILGERIILQEHYFSEAQTEARDKPSLFHTEIKADADIKNELIESEQTIQEKPPDQGHFLYALSDRRYIEKGWTKLPTEKIVRRLNTYRVRPVHPESDWFKCNKHKGTKFYDTGEKMADFTDDGYGRWYYKNGRLALDYFECEDGHKRFVVFSCGDPDERGRSQPITVLAMFDHNGNGIVFDHGGKIRLKYNQNEGVVLDRTMGPVTHWLWHSLNEPPNLQHVMINTHLKYKDAEILKFDEHKTATREDDEEMKIIEFENFLKTADKPFCSYKINMKAMKINKYLSLRVIDQQTIYLHYRDGLNTMKLNLGMILDHKEVVDSSISNIGEVELNINKLPAMTESIANLQEVLNNTKKFSRARTERELKKYSLLPVVSADRLAAATSKAPQPLKPANADLKCNCTYRIPIANNLYYNTE